MISIRKKECCQNSTHNVAKLAHIISQNGNILSHSGNIILVNDYSLIRYEGAKERKK